MLALRLLPLFLSIILPLSLPTDNHLKLPNSNLTYTPLPLYMYTYIWVYRHLISVGKRLRVTYRSYSDL